MGLMLANLQQKRVRVMAFASIFSMMRAIDTDVVMRQSHSRFLLRARKTTTTAFATAGVCPQCVPRDQL